jgi:AbiJ N-terminal domain 5
MDVVLGQRLIDLRERIASNFNASNWEEIGLLTEHSNIINGHSRLLRSLSWGDEDYAGNVLTVLRQIVGQDRHALPKIESYLDKKFPGEAHYISAKPSERKITFAPNVFQVPDCNVELDLATIMMPFTLELTPVHEAIKSACATNGLRCLRADDIWEESTIIQDIFTLIFRAQVVIADFTGKNANVMYETGIAHTLGKHVIPITQTLADVPFDMQHHRALKYLSNSEGIKALETALTKKLQQFCATPKAADDNIPF